MLSVATAISEGVACMLSSLTGKMPCVFLIV